MATYYNLASFANCQVGDVIEYSAVTYGIDFTGIQKVKITAYGAGENKDGVTVNGGLAEADFVIPSDQKLYTIKPGQGAFYTDERVQGTNTEGYYVLLVAGNSGKFGKCKTNINYSPGEGGGLIAGAGGNSTKYGQPGTQLAGGAKGVIGASDTGADGKDGDFMTNKLGNNSGSGNRGGHSGFGWYSGGSGCVVVGEASYGGGGGSGFIVGQSTSVYPGLYLGGNSAVRAKYENAISNATLTKGGSQNLSGSVIITILELVSSGPTPTIKYYDGNAKEFVPCQVFYYGDTGDYEINSTSIKLGSKKNEEFQFYDTLGTYSSIWYCESTARSWDVNNTNYVTTLQFYIDTENLEVNKTYIIGLNYTAGSHIEFQGIGASNTAANLQWYTSTSSYIPEYLSDFMNNNSYDIYIVLNPLVFYDSSAIINFYLGCPLSYGTETVEIYIPDMLYERTSIKDFIECTPYYYSSNAFHEIGV